MAAFDFPSSPTEGQQYTPVGGPTYAYTDGKWITASEGLPTFPAPGYRYLRSVYFTTVGANTYTKPADVDAVRFRVQAGGGGGGGASGSASDNASGGGAGGGGYTEKFITNPNASYTITVGGGGAGATAGANNGTAGGTSSVDAILVCSGGNPGSGGTASSGLVFTQRGSGGSITTGGDFNSSGGHGGAGFKITTVIRLGGGGGGSYLGAGAAEIPGNVGTTATAGLSGSGYGGGGSGGLSGSATLHAAGGAGAQGVVIVDEYSKLSGAGSETYQATANTRNRIVNGAMLISQENGGVSVTNNMFPVDQFSVHSPIATVTGQRADLSFPPNGVCSLKNTLTTGKPSLAATDYWQIITFIEGRNIADFKWGTADAKPVVLRFWAITSTPGTYGVNLKNHVPDRSYAASFTLGAGWTEVVIPVPGDTTGTWQVDSSRGMQINWGLAAGTNYIGPGLGWTAGLASVQPPGCTNLAAAANNTFYITNVGLYLDPDGTGLAPPYELPNYPEEVRACQRYWYQQSSLSANANRYGAAGATIMDGGDIVYPTAMRIGPAVATTTAPTYSNCSALAISAGVDHAIIRVSVTALGGYRASGGTYAFDARM